MKFNNQIKTILCLCIFASFLLDNVKCKGVSGGGGGLGGGVGGGSRFVGYSGYRGVRSAPYKAPNPNPNGKESRASGAYLIRDVSGGPPLPIYKTQEVTSYYKREGSGISAWGIIALILGILGGGTAAWFCYTVGIPLWRDRHRRNHTLIGSDPLSRRTQDAMPLQQATPSTATPSP